MGFPTKFVAATADFSTLINLVPAPYLRKSFLLDKTLQKAELLICGLGFYELYVNGRRITKGALAPYISNPDHIIYFDLYDLTSHLTTGENVIGVLHGEHDRDGYKWEDYIQKDIYVCKGGRTERYTPSFTYHGFQYVFVTGLTAEQATSDTLTYLVMISDLRERGGFTCSDETINILQTLTRRSTFANFHYIPTDCPQREKNGWTADAALSAEHTLLNLSPENSYREWMRNIRKAQKDIGELPGIVPTAGWGYHVGPPWDCVLVWLPYYTYLFCGDKAILAENAHAILRYLEYLTTLVNDDGLITYGIGDWCQTGRAMNDHVAPVRFTNTVMGMDICEKAAYIYSELDMPLHRGFAASLYQKLRASARERMLDLNTMTAESNCQTTQAMDIHYSTATRQ